MRVFLALSSLLISLLAIYTDSATPSVDSTVCRLGLCRFDQLFKSINAQSKDPARLRSFIGEDPADPGVWCTYAEALAERGDVDGAIAGFDHAIELGPYMPPILMRAINFDFSHNRARQALPLARRVLEATSSFDGALFSDLRLSKIPVRDVLASVIPPQVRAARSWLNWVHDNGSEDDLLATWSWMKEAQLLDRDNAISVVDALWAHKSFRPAQERWMDWLGPRSASYRGQEKLANSAFELSPAGGPFDWNFDVPSSVTVLRGNGLDVIFSGSENIAFSTLMQGVVVHAGHYRFAAEVQSEGLASEERPFFHIYDAGDPKVLDISSPQVEPTAPRSQIVVDFAVPRSTQALMVQLERHSSDGLANKIEGKLHLYRVSLRSSGG